MVLYRSGSGMAATKRAGMAYAGILLMTGQVSWSADVPAEEAAMRFSIGPSQQATLPFLRLRPNTCEQISNAFKVTKPPTIGIIVPVKRSGLQLHMAKCGTYNYDMMAYMAPTHVDYTMSDQFAYDQVTNQGPLKIDVYVSLCEQPPPNPNKPCP
jgi:hypothetical protein